MTPSDSQRENLPDRLQLYQKRIDTKWSGSSITGYCGEGVNIWLNGLDIRTRIIAGWMRRILIVMRLRSIVTAFLRGGNKDLKIGDWR